MKARLVKGSQLSERQIREVKAAYVHRFDVIGIGRIYQNDEEWIKAHAFYIRKDGSLASRPKHCEPVFMADYQ